MGIRKGLDFVFTRTELKILDDILPEHKRNERMDDEAASLKAVEVAGAGEDGGAAQPPADAANPDDSKDGRRASIKYTKSGLEVPLGKHLSIPFTNIRIQISVSNFYT